MELYFEQLHANSLHVTVFGIFRLIRRQDKTNDLLSSSVLVFFRSAFQSYTISQLKNILGRRKFHVHALCIIHEISVFAIHIFNSNTLRGHSLQLLVINFKSEKTHGQYVIESKICFTASSGKTRNQNIHTKTIFTNFVVIVCC